MSELYRDSIKDETFNKFKEENRKEIKNICAIPKGIILKGFEADYAFLIKHPILKNSWKSEILYKNFDYEGGNED